MSGVPGERERRESFGRLLREARNAAGLGLRETAALLGTTPVRLGEVERGVRQPEPPPCPYCIGKRRVPR